MATMARRPNGLFARAERRRRPHLIRLTPLIDVVFILLVFFMLSSSFAQRRALELEGAGPAAGGELRGALLVDVRRDGLRLSGEPVSLEQLAAAVAGHVARDPGRRVLVRPGPQVTLQPLVTVLDRLGAAGVRQVSVVGGEG